MEGGEGNKSEEWHPQKLETPPIHFYKHEIRLEDPEPNLKRGFSLSTSLKILEKKKNCVLDVLFFFFLLEVCRWKGANLVATLKTLYFENFICFLFSSFSLL